MRQQLGRRRESSLVDNIVGAVHSRILRVFFKSRDLDAAEELPGGSLGLPRALVQFRFLGLVLGLVRRARGASVAVPGRMIVLDVRWWRCWSVRVSSAVDALSKVR